MTVLLAAFGLVLLCTFAMVLAFTRPTRAERKIDRRLAEIQAPDHSAGGGGARAEILKDTHLSHIAWLNRLLQRWQPARDLRILLLQAQSRHSAGMVLSTAGALALLVFLLVHNFMPSLLLSIGMAVMAALSPFAALRIQRARHLTRFDRVLPDAIDVVARSLRAGHSLSAAIEIVSEQTQEPVRSEFRTVYKQQNFGLPFREALLELVDRIPSADLHFFATAMLVQKETGGNLVEILERTNAVIRERLRLEGEVRIYTAQGRLTGWILGLLPVAMFLLINLANPGYGRILLHDPIGQKMIGVGIVQIAIGVMIIRRIVKVTV